MAIYHFNVAVISRGNNESAVAKAAYISGEKIKNEYDGVTHDYRRKHEIVHKEILLPSNAPPRFKKRSVLWNAVETAETRKNSQTARHINAALPAEISRAEQIDLVRQYCRQCFVSRGMCCDFAIHDKGDGNPHVHILLNTRRVDENGFTTKERSWNDKALLLEWRKLWADWCNHKLYAVSDERIDHRSYEAQGIDKVPQLHLGAAVCAIEKKGYRTDKGSKNRKIQRANLKSELSQLNNEIADIKNEWREVNRAIIETELQCSLSEATFVPVTGIADLEKFKKMLTERKVHYSQKRNNQGLDTILFAKKDSEIVAFALQQLREKDIPQKSAPERNRDNPEKKRRSL